MPAAGEIMRIRLEAQSLDEDPINSIAPGGEFVLRAYVQDLREPADGVFGAYVDVTYNGDLASSQAGAGDGVANEAPYTQDQAGDARTAGLIDEAGGFNSSLTPLGPSERLLWTVLMRANSAGTVTFTPDFADDPNHEVLVYGGNTALQPDEIEFVGTTLVIGNLPTVSINDPNVFEGDSGNADLDFIVTLSAASTQTVTMDYATVDGTGANPGLAGRDYVQTSGSLSFGPGETSKTIHVPIIGDTLDEPDRRFTLQLNNFVNAANTSAEGEALLIDNDPEPTLSINNVTVTEGNPGEDSFVTFTIQLSQASGRQIEVRATATAGTALADTDFQPLSLVRTFAPGQLSEQFVVRLVNDVIHEEQESFTVALSEPLFATIANGTGTATVNDDDPDLPTLSINDVQVTELDAQVAIATLTVTLSEASTEGVFIDYATSDGTATANADYEPIPAGSLFFDPGETTKEISVPVLQDDLNEGTETFLITLTNPLNAVILKAQGQVTILDDDQPLPTLSINDVTQNEGNSGTTDFVFTVTLSAASTSPVLVDFSSVGGAAQAGADFEATTGTLTFAAGETTKSITVHVVGDTTIETDETFALFLSNPSGATIARNNGLGTITNDDSPLPTLSIGDVTVTEGNSGNPVAEFTITLSASSAQTVTVNYATSDDTAVAPGDYASTSGTLTFEPGTTIRTIQVPIVPDTVDEPNEHFEVVLSSPVNATIAQGTANGTITDDDETPLPGLTITNVSQEETDSGTTVFTFTVTLSAAPTTTVTVDFNTIAGTALAGTDFVAQNGVVTFNPGETTKTIAIEVVGDTDFESDENFSIQLANVSGATLTTSTALATITNDDELGPNFTLNDITVAEGDSGTTTATFTVTLSEALGTQATVNFATANGTALAPDDYTLTSGTLTFAAGETSKQVQVQVVGDVLDEVEETFRLVLSSAVGAAIGDAEGQATITGSDPAPSLAINNVTVDETNTGTRQAVLTVRLLAASGRTVTVNYATENVNATAGADYQTATGTLTFAPGTTEQTITLLVNGDTTDEPNETFRVNLTNASGATLPANPAGVVTITDNDDGPSISIADLTITEGDSGTKEANFVVTLSQASGIAVIVSFATTAGTAVVGQDFQAASGNLTFNAGESSKTITVRIVGDLINEGTETFTVNLTNPTLATLADGSATVTIQDNDPIPSLAIGNVSVTEGDSGTVSAVFTVTMTGRPAAAVTVNFATANGTAIAGVDYVAASGTVTFQPTETSKTFTVLVNGDLFNESDETFFVNLTNAVGATIATAQGAGTIVNTDTGPSEGEAASVAGCVYVDLNMNGVRDAGESGIAGVTVRLTGADRIGRPVDLSTTTDANGDYRFAFLVPGNYMLTEMHPGDYLDGRETAGSIGGTAAADQIFFELGAAQNGAGYNFGEQGLTPGNISRRNFIVPR